MASYSSRDRVRWGVPAGGIGAGKFEVTPSGLFNSFTFQNNWSKPLTGTDEYPGILGYHMGISVENASIHGNRQRKARLLQTEAVLNLPRVKEILYDGDFPNTRLKYLEPSLDLDISLDILSPWIPGDYRNSSLPCAFFTLKIKNLREIPVRAGFLFIGRNTSGEWGIGRRNKIHDEKKIVRLEFSNSDPSDRDVRQGTVEFSFEKEDWQTSYFESWNAVTRNFMFNSQNIALTAWDHFVSEGILPNSKTGSIVRGENEELCGAVAAHRHLEPGEEVVLKFAMSWYFPKHPLGHRYEKPFESASEVSSYAITHRDNLRDRAKRVEKSVFSLPFPEWFNRMLLANLAPFFSSSWYVRDGRFAFYEAPVICPLMGTIDVGFYGSIPLSYFFPELEKAQMRQFAAAQREDGYVPHDLGKNRIDLPSNGTTFHLWKDLNPKFILMVYRDYLWSGDRKFLKEMFPHVKRALEWSKGTDIDGNGLPDNEGEDQTFDLWGVYGTNSYTSSIYLASLLACQKMARLLGDAKLVRESSQNYLKGRESFERELWNGRYFGEACALSQLNGQWYADLLRLGDIVDARKTRKAIAFILNNNAKHSRFGMVNSVLKTGALDVSNDHSKNIWSGMNYAFFSLCVTRGVPLTNVLKEARKIWDNVSQNQKSPWNQPDTIDSKTGRYVFGDSYYRNMAIWSIPIAFALSDKKTASILQSLRSMGGNRRP